ncbi:MAG: O-antigen ligase family protein, partial [Candidatus Methylomirabilales bacterium]
KSRGGWVALAIALVTMGLLGRKGLEARGQMADGRWRGSVKKRLIVITTLGGMAVLLTLLFPGLLSQTLKRAASIFDPSDPPNRVRLLIWGSTLKMIAESPLFGIGAGNYELVYPRFRTVEEWRLSTRLVVGEAHNDYLQIAAELGLLGLGSFLWLLVNLLRAALRLSASGEEGLRRRGIGLFGALVALLVYAFFAFPLQNPASALHFWLLSGLLCACFRSRVGSFGVEPETRNPKPAIRVSIGFAWAVAIPLFALASVLIFGQLLAELHLKRMERLILQGKEAEARAEYVKAVRRYFPLLYAQELRAKAFNDQRMLQMAVEVYRRALKVRPDDPRLHADLGAIYGEMGRFNEAEASLQEALTLDPGLGEAWENLGNVHLLKGRYLEAVKAYEEAAKKGRDASAELRRKLGLARRLAGETQSLKP